jgi:hypothetical protein
LTDYSTDYSAQISSDVPDVDDYLEDLFGDDEDAKQNWLEHGED